MGFNLQSCCHRCKVKRFHFRGKEQETLGKFYNSHLRCMKLQPSNIETLEDQIQEAEWMSEYPEEE